MNDAMKVKGIDGFATGRLLDEARSFRFNSAGPQPGQFDPTPRYPDGTPVQQGFSTGTNRGRPGGKIGIGLQATTKAEIIKRYQAGEGLNPIAAAYSTSSQRVREILVQAGVTIRAGGSQKPEQRSNDMAKEKRELSPEDKHIICSRYQKGKSVRELAAQFHVGLPRIREALTEGGVETRKRGFNLIPTTEAIAPPVAVAEQVDAEPTPQPQMDDPEMHAAAAQDLARSRARELHAKSGMVIAVQELHSPVFARKQYDVPRVLESGTLFEMANPHAAAKMVESLVAKLNQVPGFQAYFEWRTEGQVGQPLAR